MASPTVTGAQAPAPDAPPDGGRVTRLGAHVDLVPALGLGGALSAVAFAGGGGTALGANTVVQICLLVAGVGGLLAVLVYSARARRWGTAAVLLFAALAAITYASLLWSVQPGDSWLEANRTLSYLGAFAAAVALGRLCPGRWRVLVAACAACAGAVAAYALLVKVFPATLDPRDPLGRLSVPLGYWNALGVIAAMGIFPCLWLGAAPGSPRPVRALAPPAIAVLISALLMSVSRGALAFAVVGLLAWFALVPLRLRGAAVLAVGAAGAAAISGWALPSHPLSDDNVATAARTSAGHTFGVVVLIALLATLAVGVLLARRLERSPLPDPQRRRIGSVLLALLALVPLLGIGALAASSRGLTGEISHVWSTATNPNGGVGNEPGRLLNLSNTRTRYWSVGLKVGEHHLLLGSGAGGFATAHQRYAVNQFPIIHAHNYLIETFADLGLIGVAISLALLGAWAVGAGRALGLERDAASRLGLRLVAPNGREAERGALTTLLLIVVVFGLHSLIDWTWFVPGTAVLALVAAGWLAGRGPLSAPVGRALRPRTPTRSPAVGMAIVLALAVTVGLGWEIAQPLRSANADSAAIGELLSGRSGAALTDAREAVSDDPLALDPLLDLSEVYAARGEPGRARAELLAATSLQPENPQSWLALGSYDLQQARQPGLALPELQRALSLDPHSLDIPPLIAAAQAPVAAPSPPPGQKPKS